MSLNLISLNVRFSKRKSFKTLEFQNVNVKKRKDVTVVSVIWCLRFVTLTFCDCYVVCSYVLWHTRCVLSQYRLRIHCIHWFSEMLTFSLNRTFCNSYVLWLLRCVQLRLVTVTFCDIHVVCCRSTVCLRIHCIHWFSEMLTFSLNRLYWTNRTYISQKRTDLLTRHIIEAIKTLLKQGSRENGHG